MLCKLCCGICSLGWECKHNELLESIIDIYKVIALDMGI
jgi:transcription elongation factor Elf1